MIKNTILTLSTLVVLAATMTAGAALASVDHTTLPFQMVDNRILVDVEINGQGPFVMMFDTGASNILDSHVAQQLGLATHDPFEVQGGGEGGASAAYGDVDKMNVGTLSFANQKFMVIDLTMMKNAIGFRKLDGLIGFEVLSRYVAEVDYERKTLRLSEPKTFRYRGNGEHIGFQFQGTTPLVGAVIDGIPGQFWLDTGDRASMTLTTSFIAAKSLVSIYRPTFEMITGCGIAGSLSTQLARTQTVSLGPVGVSKAIIRLPTATSGGMTSTASSGTIGNGILRKFNLVIDYSRREIILEKNSFYDQPEFADRSGMWLIQSADKFKVLDVVRGGPAWMAGIRIGQVINSVNGRSTQSIFLPDLREQLSNPLISMIQMNVTSSAGDFTASLKLIDLIAQ